MFLARRTAVMAFQVGFFVRDDETVFEIASEIGGMNDKKAQWVDPPPFQDDGTKRACEIF